MRWYPKTLLCNVNLASNGSAVDCDTPGAQQGRLVLTMDRLACQYHYLSHVLYILLTSTLLVFVSLAVSSLRDRTQRLPPPALVTELPVRHLCGVREEGPGS